MTTNYSDMETFVAVAESLSFVRAAEKMGITASATSKRIKRLEDALGTKLIYRTTRMLSITEAGGQYLFHAQAAMISAANAVDAAKSHQAYPQGQLKVHAPMSYGKLHLAPLIQEFLVAYPNISIILSLDDYVPDLLSAGLDISITGRYVSAGSYISKKIGELGSVICAAPGYLEKLSAPQHPRDLRTHNCLLYEHPESPSFWSFTRNGEAFEINVSGNFRSDNSEVVTDAVKAGLGIARLPNFIANQEIATGRIVQLIPAYKMPKKNLFAIYPDRTHKSAKLCAFLDFILPRLSDGLSKAP